MICFPVSFTSRPIARPRAVVPRGPAGVTGCIQTAAMRAVSDLRGSISPTDFALELTCMAILDIIFCSQDQFIEVGGGFPGVVTLAIFNRTIGIKALLTFPR